MIDWHAHVLPNMDDGSRSVSESVNLLKMLSAQNVDTVVATPHFYANAESIQAFLQRRSQCYDKLMEEISSDYAFGKRNFQYMSIPRFEDVEGLNDQETYKTTLWGKASTRSAFINKASDQKELAKKFLQFVYSRSSMVKYSAYSGTFMPLNYQVKAEEYDMFTPYMKSIMERIVDVEKVDVVIEDYYNPFILNNDTYFSFIETTTKIGSTKYIEMMLAKKETGASAAAIVAGMKERVNESTWPKLN